jgi:hypothetical protein
MVSIFSHQGDANLNHTEIPSHSSQNGSHQEPKQEMLVRMRVGVGCLPSMQEPLGSIPSSVRKRKGGKEGGGRE